MNSIKCPQCGLVNFASAPACKRCQLAFEAAPAGYDPQAGAPAGFPQQEFPPQEFAPQEFAPQEFAPAGAWGPSPYYPAAFDDFDSEAVEKNAKLGKASAAMALLAIVAMGLNYFVSRVFMPVYFLLIFVGFVVGIVAWVKLRRSGDGFGGLRNARLGTILNGLLLVVVTLAVGAVFLFNVARTAVVAKTFEVRDQPQWRKYVSPDMDFTVQMPGEPHEMDFNQRATGAGSFTMKGVGAGAPDESGAVVMIADFSAQMDALARQRMSDETFLNRVALSVISDKEITVINRRSFTQDGYSAMEFEYLDPQKPDANPADRLRGVTRVVWAPPQMYMAIITAPEVTPLYAERQTFLDSFHMLKGK